MSMLRFSVGHSGPGLAVLDRWQTFASEAATTSPSVWRSAVGQAVDLIASREVLKFAWDWQAKFGGPAAGPNGQTFSDFTRVAAWSEIDRLHDELITGEYRHGSTRHVIIPKPPGKSGTRPLAIPDIRDRVVGRAECLVLEPLLKPRFDERSFCRSGRGPGIALAYAQRLAERENRWIWIAEDLRDAFTQVPLSRLFDVVQSYLPSYQLLDLIRRSVNDLRDSGGLYQGAPLSPLLMNLYLHHFVDRRWRQLNPEVPLLRYMDDLLLLCREDDDARRLYKDLARLVSDAAMQLKVGYSKAVHATNSKTVTWLGYRFCKGANSLEIKLPFVGTSKNARDWRRYLRERFVNLHDTPDAPFAAVRLIRGVTAWAGPTLPWADTRAAYEVLRKAARSAAIEEIDSYHATLRRWRRAHESWRWKCDHVFPDESRKPFELPMYEGRTWGPDQAAWEEPAIVIDTSYQKD